MSIKLKPGVLISWFPFGRIHLHPAVYITFIPMIRESVKLTCDLRRELHASCSVHADTRRLLQTGVKVSIRGKLLRRIGRTESANTDTLRRIGQRGSAIADSVRQLIKSLHILADTRIDIPHTLTYAEFRERGIRSFSVTLGELSLSDNIQLETASCSPSRGRTVRTLSSTPPSISMSSGQRCRAMLSRLPQHLV